MGTNQILLIVLGVIIVGAAIIVGMELVKEGYDENIKDLAIQQAHMIGGLATKYYHTPEELGGGSNSFEGFSIPDNYSDGYLGFNHMFLSRQDIFLILLISKTAEYQGEPYRFYALYRPGGMRILYLYEPNARKWVKLSDSRWDIDDW